MTVLTSFVQEVDRRSAAAAATPELLPVRLAQSCVAVLPVAGAGISLFTDARFRFPVGSSDRHASDAERLQFTAGEGPCLAARAAGRPVVAPAASLARRWPLFHDQLRRLTPYRAVLALPMTPSPSGFGSIDLYLEADTALAAVDVDDAVGIAELVGAILLHPTAGEEAAWLDGPALAPRRLTMTAAGMLNVSLGVTIEQALDTLRGRAYATDVGIDDVAADVVARRVPLAGFRLDGND